MSQPSEDESGHVRQQLSSLHSTISHSANVEVYPAKLQGMLTEEQRQTYENDNTIEKRVDVLFRELGEETHQLSESLAKEKRLIAELCELLAQILSTIGADLRIPRLEMISLRDGGQVKLDSDGQVIVARADGVTERALKHYPAETIIEILWGIFPEVNHAIKTYRQKVSERVGLIGKIKSELMNLQKALHSARNRHSIGIQEQREIDSSPTDES